MLDVESNYFIIFNSTDCKKKEDVGVLSSIVVTAFIHLLVSTFLAKYILFLKKLTMYLNRGN